MKIFLVGMMGSGKSYCANYLAKKLQTTSYDLDNLIEVLEEKTISAIFDEDGEDYFRQREAELLRWFDEKKDCVIATGGGTACYHGNMEWMNANGKTIWLDEPIPVLVERLLKGKDHRPLIKDLSYEGIADFLQKKLNERLPFYSMATHHIQISSMNEKELLKIVK